MLCGPCTSLGSGAYSAYSVGVNASKPPPMTGYALARFQEYVQEFKRDLADASSVPGVVWLMRSLQACGARKPANRTTTRAIGTRSNFCFDFKSISDDV